MQGTLEVHASSARPTWCRWCMGGPRWCMGRPAQRCIARLGASHTILHVRRSDSTTKPPTSPSPLLVGHRGLQASCRPAVPGVPCMGRCMASQMHTCHSCIKPLACLVAVQVQVPAFKQIQQHDQSKQHYDVHGHTWDGVPFYDAECVQIHCACTILPAQCAPQLRVAVAPKG